MSPMSHMSRKLWQRANKTTCTLHGLSNEDRAIAAAITHEGHASAFTGTSVECYFLSNRQPNRLRELLGLLD